MQRLSAWFLALEQRERLLLQLAFWLLVPAILVLAWFEPMMQSRQLMRERLERLNSERSSMQALAQQWRSLDQQAPVLKRQDLETRIRASLKAAKSLESLTVKVLDNGSVIVETTAVPQGSFMAWLVDVRRETQAQWAEFRIERALQTDHLKVRIRFVEAGGQS
jgi:type II secretory pathway component PulM